MIERNAVFEYDAKENVWVVHVDYNPQIHTSGKSLLEAEKNISEAIGLWEKLDPEEFSITRKFGKKLDPLIDRATYSKKLLDNAEEKYHNSVIAAAKELTKVGLTNQEAAKLLGLSQQKVTQLLKEADAT